MKKRKQSAPSVASEAIYAQKGYYALTKNDWKPRFFSFLIDVCVMIAPIMIWNIIMMAVLGSIVSVSGMVIVNIAIGILLILSILCANFYIYKQTGGQSLGMRIFGYKVITSNGNDCSNAALLRREVIGFAIPFLVLMYFLNIFGVVLYWAINGILVLTTKQQRTLPDMLFHTCVVGVAKQKRVRSVKPQPQYRSRIDLHLHSDFSANGEYNVEELFQLAAKNNMQTISITDLDCAKSNHLAKRMSALYNVEYIPGIEINCEYQGIRLRVLGYFIDYTNELFATIENESLVNEKRASIARVQKFEKLIGRHIDIDRLLQNNRFQRLPGELIAKHVLTRSEFSDCELLQPYLQYDHMEEAARKLAKDYFSYGKPCYVQVKYPLLEDVLEVIKMSGGVSVLAYPGRLYMSEPQLLDELVKLGIRGLEVFYSKHTQEEMKALMKYAMTHKLYITGGSGFFHEQGSARIGMTQCPKDGERIIQDFIEAYQ